MTLGELEAALTRRLGLGSIFEERLHALTHPPLRFKRRPRREQVITYRVRADLRGTKPPLDPLTDEPDIVIAYDRLIGTDPERACMTPFDPGEINAQLVRLGFLQPTGSSAAQPRTTGPKPDLAMLIDRAVEIRPLAGDLEVGLIDEPPVARSVPAEPGSLDELRGETLHPPVDGDLINGDTALGQQLLDIPVGQPVPQVPADRDRDHLPQEPETSEDRGRARRSHRTSLQQPRSANATVPSRASPLCSAGRPGCGSSGIWRLVR
jgi:hypothetical protein